MTPAEITAIRARACAIMSALGSVLDSVTIMEQIATAPSDPFSDALVTAQHLEEAAATADTIAQHATDFATAVDALQVQHQEQARKLEGGAP